MRRRGRSAARAAARAGAEGSLAPGQTLAGLLQACKLDRAYFSQHPDANSYIRQAVPGELPRHILRETRGCAVVGVAVAQTGLGWWSKALVLDPASVDQARADAEAYAATMRETITGSGPIIPPAMIGGSA